MLSNLLITNKSKVKDALQQPITYSVLLFNDDALEPSHDAILNPTRKKLTKLEEQVIVERILDRDSRGWAFTKKGVEDMANTLLAERGGQVVGKNWVHNFVRRQYGLKTQWSCSYDRQRALTEDPRVISP